MGGIEKKVKEAGMMLKEEVKNTNTIEEGMDKFADLVDQGIAAAFNYYNEGKEGVEVRAAEFDGMRRAVLPVIIKCS